MKGLSKFSKNAQNALKMAYDLAKNQGSSKVEIHHLFMALLQDKKFLSFQILATFGVDFSPVLNKYISSGIDKKSTSSLIILSENLRNVIQKAFEISNKKSHVYVGTEHLLLALFLDDKSSFIKDLEKLGIKESVLENRVSAVATYPPGIFVYMGDKDLESDGSYSLLSAIGRDLTELAEDGFLTPLIGREKEIDKMIRILSRKTKNNPIVIGDSGVGKTAIVEGLAQRIIAGDVPLSLQDKRIISIDTASIVAGSKVRGELEEKVLDIIQEVKDDENIILFIDEIHSILGAGAAGSGTTDIADILKPALANGELRCIGATTTSSYQHIFEEDSALSRRFQPVEILELSVEESIKVLKKIKVVFEEYHGVEISDDAIVAAVNLSNRYIYDRFLPDKAIDIIDESCAREKLRGEGRFPNKQKITERLIKTIAKKESALQSGDYEQALSFREIEENIVNKLKSKQEKLKDNVSDQKITKNEIYKIVSDWSGVPEDSLSLSGLDVLKNLEKKLTKYVVGQDDAVESVVKSLKRYNVGISDSNRPMSAFLFLGPTGVGKTELSRVVAREFFGSSENLIQIDMSEMMESHSVSKLIGSPPGYVGFQQGGQLTDQIRRKPYSVVLFDEIEKAHPDVLNILLQVLEEGLLTDSKGRTASFRNTVIILTSNIGAEAIANDNTLGFEVELSEKDSSDVDEAYEEMEDRLMEELKDTLSPEFINRLDDIVIFRSLNTKDAVKIARILMKDLSDRLKERNLILDIAPSVYKLIARESFNEEYGARPIRRYIQDNVEALIADYIIDQDILPNKKTILKIRKKQDKIEVIS